MSRKEKFLSDLRAELTDSEIVAALGNGDIALPEWLAMSEGVDHVKLVDFDAGESFQMGFTTIWYSDDTQNNVDCSTCSLVNYGRDCRNNPINPTPSEIREARTLLGLTQQQAGDLIGATRRAWQEWEGGRRNMPGAKWELFLRKSKEATVLTLSDLIGKFGANGVIRIDAGNGCAGPMWCAWDDDLAGEIGGMEMSQVDPDSRAYDDDDNDRTYRQEAAYVIGDYDGDEMYASRWIQRGNGYTYRFIF